jgi:hypothetical protein
VANRQGTADSDIRKTGGFPSRGGEITTLEIGTFAHVWLMPTAFSPATGKQPQLLMQMFRFG